ncbi:MAG: glycosyltransferase [Eubacteriales bacterium]|nr:glycosyltransferase [Eubacteriales bacterium]
MGELTTSVLISTYNGEKYIIEQLDSIRTQTVPVDEVIIRDDRSKDRTREVIDQYLKEHHLDSWKLICNSQNIGWKKNFRKGMDDCTKDLVFLCDQDDIWHPDKVKDMLNCMEKNPSINVLVSDYHLKYENAVSSSRYDVFRKEMNNTGELVRIPFTSRWPYINRPGCVYCVRRSFFLEIRDYWDDEVAHDGLFWRFAMASNSLWNIKKNEIEFRRHGGNATGTRELSIASRLEEIDLFTKSFQRVLSYCEQRGDESKCQMIRRGLHWLSIRKKMFEEHRFFLWFLLAFRYGKYYSSYKGLLGDVIYYFRSKDRKNYR